MSNSTTIAAKGTTLLENPETTYGEGKDFVAALKDAPEMSCIQTAFATTAADTGTK